MASVPILRVLHVTTPGVAGGLESVVLALTAGLHARGHVSSLAAIISPRSTVLPLIERAAAMGVHVHPVLVPDRAYLREYQELVRLIRHFRPDIVHTHGYRSDYMGGLSARNTSVPWVSTAHGFTGGDWKNQFYEWLQIRSYRRAQAVVAVSHPIRRRLVAASVNSGTVNLLPNAWTPQPLLSRDAALARLGITRERPCLGWVGRLTREKGADLFLEALALIPHRNWQASIVGDGQERPALELQASRLGIAEQVTWHGLLPDAATLYPAFNCWVSSSRTEGTPMALFEAMAAHVPAVVTAVGGVPDVVSGVEALVVDPEEPSALAAAISEVLSKPGEAAARAEAAYRRVVKDFAVGPWLDAHVALYQALLMRGNRGNDA